jgi:hypothetical protein
MVAARGAAAGVLWVSLALAAAGCAKGPGTEKESAFAFTCTDPARDQYLIATIDAPPEVVERALVEEVAATFPVYDAVTRKLARGAMTVDRINEQPAADAAEAQATGAAAATATEGDGALLYEVGGPYDGGVCVFGVTTAYQNRWGVATEEMYAVRFSVRIEPDGAGGARVGVKSISAKLITKVSKGISLTGGDADPTAEFTDVQPWREADTRFLGAIVRGTTKLASAAGD